MKKKCDVCRVVFVTRRKMQIHCSDECGKEGALRKRPKLKIYDLPTGTVGALAEMIAAADLMAKGFAVFRALSPSCHCDLLVEFDEQHYRVEVTTGHVIRGVLRWPPKNDAKHDVLAVVTTADRDVVYFSKQQDALKIFLREPRFK